MIADSAVQSSTQTLFTLLTNITLLAVFYFDTSQITILLIDTSTMFHATEVIRHVWRKLLVMSKFTYLINKFKL